MNVSQKPMQLEYIGFGLLLGLIIGALDASASVFWLWKLGRPDFLIRPGTEAAHTVFTLGIALICGFCLGLAFSFYAWLLKRKIRRNMTVLCALVVAAIGYGTGYPFIIHYRQILPWLFVMHAGVMLAVFAVALALARPRTGPEQGPEKGAGKETMKAGSPGERSDAGS